MNASEDDSDEKAYEEAVASITAAGAPLADVDPFRDSPTRAKPPRYRYVLDYAKRFPGTRNPLLKRVDYEAFLQKIRKRT